MPFRSDMERMERSPLWKRSPRPIAAAFGARAPRLGEELAGAAVAGRLYARCPVRKDATEVRDRLEASAVCGRAGEVRIRWERIDGFASSAILRDVSITSVNERAVVRLAWRSGDVNTFYSCR